MTSHALSCARLTVCPLVRFVGKCCVGLAGITVYRHTTPSATGKHKIQTMTDPDLLTTAVVPPTATGAAESTNPASSTTMATTSKKTSARETRYECLLKLLDKALSQSKVSFDAEKAVQDCYGEDASIFEDVPSSAEETKDDSGNANGKKKSNLLIDVIENMIDTVNERVKEEIEQFLEDNKVCENLTLVDSIIAQLDEQDAEQAEAEINDRESALRALDAVKLPKDVSPDDIVSYHKFEVRRKERDALAEELAKVEAEVKQLEEQQAHATSRAKDSVQQLGKVEQELERSADVCTLGVAATRAD